MRIRIAKTRRFRTRRRAPRVGATLLVAVAALALPVSAHATTINVTQPGDRNLTCGAAGACSLREAVAVANAAGEGSSTSIVLAPDSYSLASAYGPLVISGARSVRLMAAAGAGAGNVSVHPADAAIRLVQVENGAAVTISDLSFHSAGGVSDGAAIFATDTAGPVRIERSWFSDNVAQFGGGAISRREGAGALTIVDSHFLANLANGTGFFPGFSTGGALYLGGSEPITISGSTFESNGATGTSYAHGGAIAVDGSAEPISLAISTSEFFGNYAFQTGGAIHVTSSTPTTGHTLSIQGSTFFGNRSSWDSSTWGTYEGGALSFNDAGTPHSLRMGNTVFVENGMQIGAGSYMASECTTDGTGGLAFTSTGGNRYTQLTPPCFTTILPSDGVNASAASLGLESYVPYTTPGNVLVPGYHSISATSPLVDAGVACPSVAGTDVRRGTRSVGHACDIGAYEVGAVTDIEVTSRARAASTRVGESLPIELTLGVVSDAHLDGFPRSTVSIAFSAPVSLASSTLADGSCSSLSPTQISCEYPPVALAQVAVATLDVRPSAAGTLAYTATAAPHDRDPNPLNNGATVQSNVSAANTAPACAGGAVTATVGRIVALALRCSDADGNPLVRSIVTPPATGTLGVINQTAATVAYTAVRAGLYSVAFAASDGSDSSNVERVTITAVPAAATLTLRQQSPRSASLTCGARMAAPCRTSSRARTYFGGVATPAPLVAGQRVTIRYSRRNRSGRWIPVFARRTTLNASGRYSVRLPSGSLSRGAWRATATLASNSRTRAKTSSARYLTIV